MSKSRWLLFHCNHHISAAGFGCWHHWLVVKSSASVRRGIRRSLGPSGTRGTIELLCRGGGQTATQEVPTVVGYKKHLFKLYLKAEPLSPQAYVGYFVSANI